MELTQKTKPLIVISLHEIAQTHRHLGTFAFFFNSNHTVV